MAIKKPLRLLLILIAVSSSLILHSCEKDRIQSDDYQDMESFYNDNKEEEQEYTIDSLGSSCWVTCQKGTRICTNADMQELPGGLPVYYPYKLKVVELYSAKDIILWRSPSVSSGGVLETSAQVRVRTFKDGTQSELKAGRIYGLETATLPVIQNNMEAYYGFTSGSNINWTSSLSSLYPGFNDTLSVVSATPAYYAASVARTGFFSPSRPAPVTSATTTVSFTVAGTNTQNIQLFLVFDNFKSIVKADNLTATQIPTGEPVKMIAFAKKQDGNFYMDQQNLTITANMQVPLNMVQTTESAVLTALGGL
jgi:hypothetical protein